MTFGIYLCINCARKHRSYGVHISFVRSLTLDRWTPKQLEFMKLGGNKRLRDLFEQEHHEFPDPHNYTCDLAEDYKLTLKSDVYKALGLSDDDNNSSSNSIPNNSGSGSSSSGSPGPTSMGADGNRNDTNSNSGSSSDAIFGEDFTKDMKKMDTSYGNRYYCNNCCCCCFGTCNGFSRMSGWCTIL